MPVVAAVGTVLLITFMLWFAFGTQRNIARGNDLLRWLQGGLPLVGRKTTLRWFGSSAVQLEITEAKAPYTAAQVNVVLEPRDLGWLWAWARRRGRRDFLILRGTLAGPPRFEVEVGGSRGWTAGDRLDRLDPDAWVRARWEDADGAVEVAHSGRATNADLADLHQSWDDLAGVVGSLWRVSVRNLAPHVEVHLEPPTVQGDDAADPAALVGAFAALGRLVTRDL
ncbi:MAG: hypothetical protein ACRD2C_05555 [Acidimicrobiales bacterium]